ncbi:MAG: 50S ribosomal protein L11 methyltransferase [Chloroflexi bacterium]|nr:50S ribosomal protein L11 methyltransferase [Chloroflexota bacterium]
MSDSIDVNDNWIPFLTVAIPPKFVVRTLRPASTYAASRFGQQPEADALVIDVVEHGVFGSGAHPTTQMCLSTLAELVTPASRVLDLGCGSGILGIGAARLGAASVQAVDIEPAAVLHTKDNAERNAVADRIDARLGSIEGADGPFDVIVANLLLPIFKQLIGPIADALAPQGKVICSGVLEVQTDRLSALATAHGLTLVESVSQRGWSAMVFARP